MAQIDVFVSEFTMDNDIDNTYLDAMFSNTQILNDIAYELSAVASAFYTTGNKTMGDRLDRVSADILRSAKGINNAVSVELNDKLKISQESTANMLHACLAGITLSKSEDSPADQAH